MASQPIAAAAAQDRIPNDKDIDVIKEYFQTVDQPAPEGQESQAQNDDTSQPMDLTQPEDEKEDSSDDSSTDSSDDSSSSSDDDNDDDDMEDADESNLPTVQDAVASMLANVTDEEASSDQLIARRLPRSSQQPDSTEDSSKIRAEIDHALANDDDDDENDVVVPKNIDTAEGFNGYYAKLQDRVCPGFPTFAFAPDVDTATEYFATVKHWSGNLLILQFAPEFHTVPEGFRVVEPGTIVCLEDNTILGCVDELFGPVKEPLYSLRYNFDGYQKVQALNLQPGAKVLRVVSTSNTTMVNDLVDEQRREEERLREAEESNPNAEYLFDDDGEPIDPSQASAQTRANPGMVPRGGRGGQRGGGSSGGARGFQPGARGGRRRGGDDRGRGRGGRGNRGSFNGTRGGSYGSASGYRDPDAPAAAAPVPSFGSFDYTPNSRSNMPAPYPSYPTPPAATPQYNGYNAANSYQTGAYNSTPQNPFAFHHGAQQQNASYGTLNSYAYNAAQYMQNMAAHSMPPYQQQQLQRPPPPPPPQQSSNGQNTDLHNMLANMTPAQRAALVNMVQNNQAGGASSGS